MTTLPPNIKDFRNTKSFLIARYNYLKKIKPQVSHRYIAKKANISHGYLMQVFRGRSNIGLNKIGRVCAAFQLNDFEVQYLTILVILDQINDKRLKSYFRSVLDSMKTAERFKGKDGAVSLYKNVDQGAFSSWLDMVIFEMLSFKMFIWDASWILEALNKSSKVDLNDIQKSMERLCLNKLVKVSGKTAMRTDPLLHELGNPFDNSSYLSGSGNYFKALDVFLNPKSFDYKRVFTGTIALSHENAKKLGMAFDDFVSKLSVIESLPQDPEVILCLSYVAFNALEPADDKVIEQKA